MPHPGPFRSRLIPYVDQIKAWRRAGKTWKEVTQELAKLGVKTDPGTACRFIERYQRRPYPRGAEPEHSPAPALDHPVGRPCPPPTSPPYPSPDDPGFAEAEPDDPTPVKTKKLRELREQQERQRCESEQRRNPTNP